MSNNRAEDLLQRGAERWTDQRCLLGPTGGISRVGRQKPEWIQAWEGQGCYTDWPRDFSIEELMSRRSVNSQWQDKGGWFQICKESTRVSFSVWIQHL